MAAGSRVNAPTLAPVKTPMIVSKSLPCVVKTAVPETDASHSNQIDLPPGLPGIISGSPALA